MHKKTYLLLTIALTMLSHISLTASSDTITLTQRYTKEKPLVYEDAYNQWPYSFINDEGEPDGYNIDVIKLLLNKLNIPFVVRLTHPAMTQEDIRTKVADLTLSIYSESNSKNGDFGMSVVSLMTHSIASPLSNPTRIKKFTDIRGNNIIVNANSICHQNMIEAGIERYAIPHEDMPEAVMQISTADSGQVLWNTMSLKYLINKYHLHNLQITPIRMNNDEFRFQSNDSLLLAKLDHAIQTVKSNEELQPIRNKWFFPESKSSGIPYYIWYIATILGILAFTLFIITLIYRYRLKKLNIYNRRQNRRLALYMRSGHIQMWTYDTEKKKFYSYDAESDLTDEFTPGAFSIYFNSDDFKQIMKIIADIENGIISSKITMTRCHNPETPEKDNFFDLSISVLNTTNGKPAKLLGTLRNITNERKSALEAKDLLQRYNYVFNTSMADMMYFDSKGILTDLNDKACDTFGITNREELLADNISMNEITEMFQIDDSKAENIWTTAIFNLDDLPESNRMKNYIGRKGVVYYELRMQTVRDNQNMLICILLSAIDISETTNVIMNEKKQTNIIDDTTKRIREYINSINNALNVSNIRIANYYPDSRMLTIKHNIGMKRMELSQMRCLEASDPSEHKKISKIMRLMDKRKAGLLTIKLKTLFKDNKGRNLYLQFNFVPIIDDKNNISHYFGLCRDISELTETDEKLKEEMKKAQETELLKSAFMTNMSHDIRTPLNSIVGFSELFNTEHSEDDEALFISEIKNNTSILLNLINDILFLSRLDANMIDFKTEPTDVATIFKANCDMGWSKNLSNDVKTIIECHDSDIILLTDGAHIARITEILAENAALYCKHGEIKAKCEYLINKLIIRFTDTGVGMSEEALKHVFDRQEETENVEHCSTKLGLFICKELTEKMGGTINISSSLGKGSSIQIIIPCEKAVLDETSNTNGLTSE